MDELTTALEVATDQELRYLAEILFRRKFNPLDYIATPEVMEVQSWERQELISAIATRFRFLAADGFTVLKGGSEQLSYRHILERVCRHLKVSYTKAQTVAEIESELFLHMLSRSWGKLSASEQRKLNQSMQSALTEADLHKTLPANVKGNVGLLLKGSGALAVSTVVQPAVLNLLARKFALHLATYQVGREALKAGGTAIATKLQTIFSTQIARQGMVVATARYGAARTLFSFLTPALWGVFFADLGWRSIATNYGRIIPVIFTIAQIRLLRDLG